MFLKRLKCKIIGHDLRVLKVYPKHTAKMVCVHCQSKFLINDERHLMIPWDKEMDAFYTLLAEKYLGL